MVLIIVVMVCGSVTQLYAQPNRNDSNESFKTIKIYPVPNSFQEGYVSLITLLVTTKEELIYPTEPSATTILSATPVSPEDTLSANLEPPLKPVYYDSKLNIISVLADEDHHQEVQRFLDQLKSTKYKDTKIQFRIGFLERTIHPKLKEYPFEFRISGKAWGKGRDQNKRPPWINNFRERYPDILFSDVDIDRNDDDTEFEIHGFAKQKQPMDELIQIINDAKDTNSRDRWEQHDFMKESQQNLVDVLSGIFPATKLAPIISSLQTALIYQVSQEAALAVESKAPGFLRTNLGDEFNIEIKAIDGISPKGQANIEVFVYHKDHPNDTPFEPEDLHLATSLLVKFNQINMVGIRHHDRRYVIVLSMEEVISIRVRKNSRTLNKNQDSSLQAKYPITNCCSMVSV